MLYVGDLLGSEKGFIHSTGYDFNGSKDPIYIGEDSQISSDVNKQAIRYNSYNDIITQQIYTNSVGDGKEKRTYSITILRPINDYCGSSNSCSNVIGTGTNITLTK
jgi:hypothetical protein